MVLQAKVKNERVRDKYEYSAHFMPNGRLFEKYWLFDNEFNRLIVRRR